jgi:molecular chaperone GrpE
VTSKEPTLADKQKTARKVPVDTEEQVAGENPTEHEAVADASDAAGSVVLDENDQLIDNESVTVDGAEIDVEVDPDSKPNRPSAKEVLNRLLEKNEIILKLNKDNAEKEKQLKDLNEKWLRSVAEFENYRKRSRKEWELLKQQSKTEVILEILNTIDDFERAFSVTEDEDSEFVQGIRLIYNNLVSVLKKFGVQEIESYDRSFDPSFHMAVGQLETDEVDHGHVAEVIQKGYRLDETVIRPARVIVAK